MYRDSFGGHVLYEGMITVVKSCQVLKGYPHLNILRAQQSEGEGEGRREEIEREGGEVK